MLVFALSLQGVFVWVPVARAVGDGAVDSTVKIVSGTTNGPTLATSDAYGHSVTSVGDLNNDGVADLVVGAIGDDTGSSARGAIYIHYMNVDGTIDSTVKIASGTANGPSLASGDQYGTSVASLGDLNNDGVADLAVGAFADNGAGTDRGAVHIHYMNTDGTIDSTVELNGSTTNGATLIDNDNYGYSVASLGDLNNDGVVDLAVGAIGDDTGGSTRGAVYIHYMNTNGTVDSTVKIASGTTNGPTIADADNYGYSVTSLGDLNNDGVEDLAVGAPADDTSGNARGAVYIHYMNTDGTIDSTVKIDDTTTNGPVLADTTQFGAGVASLGDFDGDGVADLVVGARGDDTGGSDRGAIHILSMNTDGTVDATVKIASGTTNGPTLGDTSQYGVSVASLGDLNNDGSIDLLVGAPFDDTGSTDRGAIHVHFMNSIPRGAMEPASTVEINDSTTNGPILADDDRYGGYIAPIGDLNRDGVDDLAVGTFTADVGGSNRGAVHISFMNVDGSVDSTVEINDSTTNGPVLANGDFYGDSVAAIGDLNRDGVVDLAVGAVYDDAGGTDRGAVHIHFMNMDGSIDSTVEINSTTTNGPTLVLNDDYGISVAGIGDLNRDGIPDIAVGADSTDVGGEDRGSVFIHYLNTNGSVQSTVELNDSTSNGATLADFDYYGNGLANIGDLNLDGVQDIAVGASLSDDGGTDKGAMFIHFMNTDGSIDSTVEIDASTTNGPSLTEAHETYYGNRIDPVGDINQDGVGDIIVGSYYTDEGGLGRGSAHIHFMNTDGSLDATLELNSSTTNGAVLADGDYYGSGVAGIGDLNNDGVLDVAVGALFDDAGGNDRGAVHIHFMQEDFGTNDPTLNNSITASRLKAGASSTYNFGFTLQNTITGTLTITFPAGFTVTAAATSGACTGGTVGTFGFTSSTLTAVKTGCTAGALTLSGATVTNHSTPGAYTVSWVNDDPGEGVIYIIDDDQVTVTGNVDPTLTFNAGMQDDATACDGTFSGNGGTLALGVLTTGSVTTSDASGIDHICTRLSTNASGGASITVKSLNGTDGLKSTSVPTDTIPSATATLSAGTAGYGLCTGSVGGDSGNDAISGAASPTRSSPFNTTCTNAAHNVGGLTTSAQNLWTLTGPSQNAFVRAYVKAAISGTTAAHADYADTLTFIGTGTF